MRILVLHDNVVHLLLLYIYSLREYIYIYICNSWNNISLKFTINTGISLILYELHNLHRSCSWNYIYLSEFMCGGNWQLVCREQVIVNFFFVRLKIAFRREVWFSPIDFSNANRSFYNHICDLNIGIDQINKPCK